MGFVDDDRIVVRQDLAIAGEVGAEQVEVGHDDVRIAGGGTGSLGEAALSLRALGRPGTVVGAHRDHGPGLRGDLRAKLGHVTGGGRGLPVHQRADLGDQAPVPPSARATLEVERCLDATVSQLQRLLPAEVVRATLEHGDDRVTERRSDQWRIPAGELLLERLGGGGHHHGLPALRCGHQIGE